MGMPTGTHKKNAPEPTGMLISIVIPCYNAEKTVETAIRSALEQSHAPKEIIVVDDGSTDGSLEIIRGFGDAIWWMTGQNHGAPAARNRGLAEAGGEYIQFLDADDRLDSRKLAHQVDLIEAAPVPPGFIAGASRRIHLDGGSRIFAPETDDPWIDLMRTRLGNTCANLWRREAVLSAGGWREDQASSQEYDLMFRLLKNGETVLTDPAVLTTVVQQPASISSSKKQENWIRYIALRREIGRWLRENGEMTAERESALHEMLFLAVRNLYAYSPEEAVALHRELIPRGYSPGRYSRMYRMVYRLLGFAAGERLTRMIRR